MSVSWVWNTSQQALLLGNFKPWNNNKNPKNMKTALNRPCKKDSAYSLCLLVFKCQLATPQGRITWGKGLSWEITCIRLACKHICGELSWLFIDVGRPTSLWTVPFSSSRCELYYTEETRWKLGSRYQCRCTCFSLLLTQSYVRAVWVPALSPSHVTVTE